MAYNVLAVDDSSTVRAIIAKTLKLSGVDVARFDEASNGDEALRMLRGGGYDLVFCDLNMPGMTGFELVDALRRDGLIDSVAVIVVSSVGTDEDIDALRSKGVRGYLRKPLRPEKLRLLVNDVMGASHGPRS